MNIMKTRELERFVKNAGDAYKASGDPGKIALVEDALTQLKPLLEFAKTNFAMCANQENALIAVSARCPLIQGGGSLIHKAVSWLYAPAQEIAYCDAPLYIQCDKAVACDGKKDRCTHDGLTCPFASRTGTFE